MWIDSHCHLDAGEFDLDRTEVAAAARHAGVGCIVIPAVARSNFDAVRELAHASGNAYALGIHPLFSGDADDSDLSALRETVALALDDPRFVGIGEIGLDYFVETLDDARQRHVFTEQLKIARDFDLPVICHVRRAQDQVASGVRRFGIRQGIAHAFNGSNQQAEAFLALGFKLGFGGALTFERARQIRRLAASVPLDALVIETDAPDISPAWRYKQRNTPDQVPAIAAALAAIRGIEAKQLEIAAMANTIGVLPRLAKLLDTGH